MIIVTGGLGLVGSWLVRMLLEKGKDVVTFSRSAPGKKSSMFEGLEGNWEHIRGTFTNISDVLSLVNKVKPEVIYHLGGMLSIPSEANPQESYRTNVEGMFNILEAARLFNTKQVIYASTNGTYGEGLDNVSTIDDNTVQRPITIYGCTKVFGELIGTYYSNKYGLDFRSIRLPAIVGPGSKTKHLSVYAAWAIEKCYFNGEYDIFVSPETLCPILYFKDAANTFYMLSNEPNKNIKTKNYNIVGIEPIPKASEIKEIVEAKIPGARISYKEEPLAMQYQSRNMKITWDDTPAKTEWNWKPFYGMVDTVDDFIKELDEHAEWYA